MSTNYTPPYPIPYEHDTCYQQPPVRHLFSGDRWLVPEAERPANWRKMVGIRDVEPPKPKIAYAPIVRSRPEPKRKPGAGRPRLDEAVRQRMVELAGQRKTAAEIAAEVKCSVPSVSRYLRKYVGPRARKYEATPGTVSASGNLTIVEEIATKWGDNRMLCVRCVCGKVIDMQVTRFYSGKVNSCGCLTRHRRGTSHDAEIARRRAAGESMGQIAEAVGVNPKTVRRVLAILAGVTV